MIRQLGQGLRLCDADAGGYTDPLKDPVPIAGPGHDHGDTAPQATSSALPRFTAVSEDLELVGIVNGKLITLYLDRFKDNSPVNDAQIEIDIAGSKYQAQKHADGEYEVTLKEPLKPGVMAITATINAGELIDLLATELDLHADADAPGIRDAWKAIAMWIGAGLLALIALGAIVRFRHQARRAYGNLHSPSGRDNPDHSPQFSNPVPSLRKSIANYP